MKSYTIRFFAIIAICCLSFPSFSKEIKSSKKERIEKRELRRAVNDLENILKKYFNPENYDVSNVDLSSEGEDKILSGSVSFFGSPSVTFKGVLGADKKAKSITATFPPQAVFNLGHVDKLSEGKLRRLWPARLPKESGIRINDFTMLFEDGDLTGFETNLETADWNFLDFGTFKMEGIGIYMQYFPKKKEGTGEITGKVSISGNGLTLKSKLGKDELVLIGNLKPSSSMNVKNLIIATAGQQDASAFFGLVPGEFFSSITLPELVVTAKPKERSAIFEAISSMGSMAISMQKKEKKDIKMSLYPNPGFKFSQISSTLGILDDDVRLENPILVVANSASNNVKIPIPSGKQSLDPGPISVKDGMNLLANIDPHPDIKKILKIQKVNLRGTLSGSKIDLAANQRLNIDLGGGVKFQNVAFGLEAVPALLSLGGSILVPVEGDKLQFSTTFNTSPTPPKFGGDFVLEALNGDGNASIWQNPFGIPGLGISNLGGGADLIPAPPFISRIMLKGDLLIGLGQDAIPGKLDLELDVADPLDSKINASVSSLTVLGVVKAFTKFRPSGELESMMRTGFENVMININPKQKEFAASGRISILGQGASLSASFTNGTTLSMSGSMDPLILRSGNFTYFSITGNGQANPSFAFSFGEKMYFRMNGKISVLETMTAAADIQIDENGFSLKASGNILGGAFRGDIEITGRDLGDKPDLYAKLTMSQDIVGKFKSEMNSYIQKQSNGNAQAIRDLKKKVNTGDDTVDDILKGALTGLGTIENTAATAGMLIVEGMVPDITAIKFEGSLNEVSTSVNVEVYFKVGGKEMPPVALSMNLKGDVAGEIKKMASVMGKQVLKQFESLGDEVTSLVGQAGEFMEDVGQGLIVAGEKMGQFVADVGEDLDVFWNGEAPLPVKSAGPLSQINTTTRHYRVTIHRIEVTAAWDDPISKTISQGASTVTKGGGAVLGAAVGLVDKDAGKDITQGANQAAQSMTTNDPTIEVYGTIIVEVGRSMNASPGTNSVAWSRKRVNGISTRAGNTISVNNTKNFYIQNGSAAYLKIRSKIKEFDEGEHHSSDEGFGGGHQWTDIGNWDWRRGVNQTSFFEAHSTNKHGQRSTVKVHYTVELVPKVSLQKMQSAVASRNIENVKRQIRLGGDVKEPGVLNPAVRNKDRNTLNFLLASGAKVTEQDVITSLNKQFYDPSIANRLLARSKVPVSAAMMNSAIDLNDSKMVAALIYRGGKPDKSHLTKALNANMLKTAEILMVNKVPVNSQDLAAAVNANDYAKTNLIMRYGARPDINMLNKAVGAKNQQMVNLLLTEQVPDQNSYLLAAQANDFNMVSSLGRSGIPIQTDGPSQKAIDFNNLQLLNKTFELGANPNNALNYAVGKANVGAINAALKHHADPNPVLPFAVNKNDLTLFTDLIKTYKANSTTGLYHAIGANNIQMATIALVDGGANPNTRLKEVADAGNTAMVRLLVSNHGDPELAAPGTVAKNDVALMSELIKYGASANNAQFVQTAANNSSLDMVKLLVNNGANPDYGTKISVTKRNYNMTQFLLVSGANPNGLIADPATQGDGKMVNMLLNYGANADEGMNGAVNSNHAPIVKSLLDFGADTKKYIAIPSGKGNYEMSKMLLDFGGNPDDGMLPSARGNHTNIAVMLLEAGANVNGVMPISAGHGNTKIVQLLLNKNVNPTEGIRPAVSNNHTETSILLLDNGANISGMIPISSGHGNDKVVMKLLEKGANPDNGTVPAVKNKHVKVAKILIDSGANVKDPKFLQMAVDNKQGPMVTVLDKGGCDVHHTNDKGNSFLHQSSQFKGEVELVKALLGTAIDVNAKNNFGNTALHLAAKEGNKNLESVTAIAEAGADLTIENDKGKTILKVAKGGKVKKYLKTLGAVKKKR
ncbi:MAG: ankyrin repeat domain-containing protein [bacterium]|nr:ankyrin repeat domain-containing protein [bacterium]